MTYQIRGERRTNECKGDYVQVKQIRISNNKFLSSINKNQSLYNIAKKIYGISTLSSGEYFSIFPDKNFIRSI